MGYHNYAIEFTWKKRIIREILSCQRAIVSNRLSARDRGLRRMRPEDEGFVCGLFFAVFYAVWQKVCNFVGRKAFY